MSFKKGLRKLGSKFDDGRRKVHGVTRKLTFKNPIAKKLGGEKIDKKLMKTVHNPKVVRIVGAVVAVVASIYATPAAGKAIIAASKIAADRIAKNLTIANAQKKDAAARKTFDTVQEKLKEIPYEQRVIVKDAYDKYGDKAFKRPEIIKILTPTIEAGTKVLANAVAIDEGQTSEQAHDTSIEVANAATKVVPKTGASTGAILPLVAGVALAFMS